MPDQSLTEVNSTILIVDDQLSSREVLKGLLNGPGYNLAFASSGIEALAQAANLTPDLILLDIMMPDLDGFEVCRRVRADSQLAEVPVIMVTALDDSGSRLQGIEAGADDFISKPFNQVELQTRVRTITRLNRYRRLVLERTQRQAAEEEIHRRGHELFLLKETERVKDKFVSNVSHELRTPLSIITLISGNLDTLYEKLDDTKRLKMIQDIRQHAQVLDYLISDILALSRLDADQISMERAPLNLAQLVREEVDKQLPLAHRKGQILCVNGLENLGIYGHDGQLRQVLRNLLNNAIKYTPDGGQVTCECAIQGQSAELNSTWPDNKALPGGQWAVLRVADRGIGIKPEDLPHLFERFYRVKNQENTPGTGLGLSIVREIVELHGGYIGVDSIPGKGSSFAIYLRLANEKEGVD